MNTMEITKFVAGFCGSLLVFLLIKTAAQAVYGTGEEGHAGEEHYGYEIAVAEPGEGAAEEAPAAEIDINAVMAAADAAAGEAVFRRCAACHKLDGTNGVGPHLDGVFDRPVGSVAGFGYSPALAAHGGNWTAEELYHFIHGPKEYIPGTAMSFAGITSEQDLANLIAFLQTK